MINEKQKIELYVEGMHCAACEILLEKKLIKHKDIDSIKANLKTNTIIIEGPFGDKEKLSKELTYLVEEKGYKIYMERPKKQINWNDFIIAIPIASFIALIFIILQTSGILNIVNTTTLSLPVIFLIGIIASVSTCMAVVGGLVLSLSATYAKEEKKNKCISQALFHISRVVAFFILGGIIGLIGSAFTLNTTTSFILSIIVAFVMIILAINLLDIFDITKKFQFHLPKFLTKKVLDGESRASTFSPILIGAITFFLPCGFTQAMQIQALRSGTFINGALIMFVFSLGTLPVLALISFTSIEFSKSNWSGIFFKTAGLIILFFAAINLIGALSAMGLIHQFLNI